MPPPSKVLHTSPQLCSPPQFYKTVIIALQICVYRFLILCSSPTAAPLCMLLFIGSVCGQYSLIALPAAGCVLLDALRGSDALPDGGEGVWKSGREMAMVPPAGMG